MEKKTETTIMIYIYRGYVRAIWGVYRGYIGIMEKEMETTIQGLGLGPRAFRSGRWGEVDSC